MDGIVFGKESCQSLLALANPTMYCTCRGLRAKPSNALAMFSTAHIAAPKKDINFSYNDDKTEVAAACELPDMFDAVNFRR